MHYHFILALFSISIFCTNKCLEFQEIKGLAGSSGRETVCVSSWSTPLESISSVQGSCACVCVKWENMSLQQAQGCEVKQRKILN